MRKIIFYICFLICFCFSNPISEENGISFLPSPFQSLVTEASFVVFSSNDVSLPIVEKNALLPIPYCTPSITERMLKLNKKINVVLTGYSSTVEETDDTPFITSWGKETRDGIVANNMLPFGTKIIIPEVFGEKIFIVEDRMNPRVDDYHFDIWFDNKESALNFGVKNTYIEILEN